MVQFLEASIGFKLDTDKVRPELNRFAGQIGSDAEHIGKMLSARMIDVNSVKAKLAEIKNAVSAVRQMTEFGFKVKDLEGSKQGSQMLDAMTRQLSVLQNQFMELGRQKQKFLSEPDSPVTARALQEIAHQQAEIMRQRGLLGQMKPQLENRTKYLEGSEAKEAAREAMAANAIRIRQAAELEAAARREQAANDISKATSRNMLSQRQRGEDADRKEALKAMRGGITPRERFEAEDRAAADAAASAAMKRRNEMELRNRAMQEQQAKDDNRAAMPFYNRLMEPGNNARMPPRMDGRGAAGGPPGSHSGRNAQMMLQASYGVQDLITVMGAGGSFQQGMVGMSNNIGTMLTGLGGVHGALLGIGATAAAIALPALFDAAGNSAEAMRLKAERLKNTLDEFAESGRRAAAAVEFGGATAGRGFSFDYKLKDARQDRTMGEKHSFKSLDDNLRNEQRQAEAEHAEITHKIRNPGTRLKELDALLLRAHNQAENSQWSNFGGAKPHPEEVGAVPISKEQIDAAKQERDEVARRHSELFDRQQEASAKAKQTKQQREAIAREVAAEDAKNADVEKKAFDKRIRSRLTGSMDSEFEKRREQITEERDEELRKIGESSLSPEEKTRRRWKIWAADNFRRGHVDRDESRAQNRFMSRLESQQKGTGAVAAIKDRLTDDLDQIDKLFKAGPDRDAARSQALGTASAENKRIINANRPKGGDYLGIEDLSKHIQSALFKDNPDEKAIKVATEAAALKLQTIIDKMAQGFVMGAK